MKITVSPQPDLGPLKKFFEIRSNAKVKIINEVLEKTRSAVCDAINILNNIVLNLMAKISDDEPFEKHKSKDTTKDSG